MFTVNEAGALGKKTKIAEFATFDEAERYVHERPIVCYERDADHPGCADVFLTDGRLWTIEGPPEPAAATETIVSIDDEGYPPACTDPDGHEWPDVEESDRCLCVHCGADGDA